MNHYIIPLQQNDPRLFTHMSQAFSLVDLGKRLLDAAKNGDVEEVRNLMNSGAPFTTDWLGISPLHFACMNGHLSTCEALLRAGISRDARTKVDRTPLHLAAQEGHADIVELLLRSGADLEAKDMLLMTALHWAAERGHAHVVSVLMRYGADPKVPNKFEMSPLEIATQKSHKEAVVAMKEGRLNNGASNVLDSGGYILTEEETLVPAACPADEVVVTAVDEGVESSVASNIQTQPLDGNAEMGQLVNLEDGRSAIVVPSSTSASGLTVLTPEGIPADAALTREALAAVSQVQQHQVEEHLIVNQLILMMTDDQPGALEVSGLCPTWGVAEVSDWLAKQGVDVVDMGDGYSLIATIEHEGNVLQLSVFLNGGTITFEPMKDDAMATFDHLG